MPCHSINASQLCQVHSIGCIGFQEECLLHYQTADSVLTSGCSFIGQHIWIKICIVLTILGRYMEGKWFSPRKICMWIRVSSLPIDNFETLSSSSVTGWGGWCSGQWSHRIWSRLWSLLFASVVRRCTCSFASPECLQIVCSVILASNAPARVLLTKHSRDVFLS